MTNNLKHQNTHAARFAKNFCWKISCQRIPSRGLGSPRISFPLASAIAALLASQSVFAAYYWDDNSDGANFGTAGASTGDWAAPTAGPTAGWVSGDPTRMYPFADHYAKLGLVSISVQYRLFNVKAGVTVFDCVKDTRSAVRYVRAHANEMGIDPQKTSSAAVRLGASRCGDSDV